MDGGRGRHDGAVCYSVMRASNAACFGPSSRTAVTKQDKQRRDKIASVFKRGEKKKKKTPWLPESRSHHGTVGKLNRAHPEYIYIYINTILCRDDGGSVRSGSTREPPAILWRLRRGDQLGSRRDARRLLGFLHLRSSHKLYPFNLCRNILPPSIRAFLPFFPLNRPFFCAHRPVSFLLLLHIPHPPSVSVCLVM